MDIYYMQLSCSRAANNQAKLSSSYSDQWERIDIILLFTISWLYY